MQEQNAHPAPQTKSIKKQKRKFVWPIAAGVATAVVLTAGAVAITAGFSPDKDTEPTADVAGESASNDSQRILDMLEQHMILPEDDKPVMASIKDVSKLKEDSNFYKNAENGDRLIVFPGSKRAIIFSTDDNIIVNAGLVVDTDQ